MVRRSALCALVSGLALAGLTSVGQVPATAQVLEHTSTAQAPADARAKTKKPRCQGKVATIVTSRAQPRDGTKGDDVIVGRYKVNGRWIGESIDGKGGDDLICTGGGDDLVDGGRGNDVISTGAGDDGINVFSASTGNDKINSGAGADDVFLRLGATLRGVVRTGSGNDSLSLGVTPTSTFSALSGDGKDKLTLVVSGSGLPLVVDRGAATFTVSGDQKGTFLGSETFEIAGTHKWTFHGTDVADKLYLVYGDLVADLRGGDDDLTTDTNADGVEAIDGGPGNDSAYFFGTATRTCLSVEVVQGNPCPAPAP